MIESLDQCDGALYRLLSVTLLYESAVALRDREILAIQKLHGTKIERAFSQVCELESEVTAYCLDHREEIATDEKKSLQLHNGVIGFRAPSNPALVPLNEKWTWADIAAKVRELWGKKYFHKPKPPGIDKVKLKKDLTTPEHLAECGLKLDDKESFYFELNRQAMPDQAQAA